MLSFLGRPLPPAFDLLVITIAPGRDRPFEPAEWRDAIAVVERGAVDVGGVRFRRGAVLALSGGPLRNRGSDPAVLAVVRRSVILHG
jgi:hypothetical protein